MTKTRYKSIKPHTTKDGSIIRELMHPDVHGNRNQSLAEATVPPGLTTGLHRHNWSEEIYHITQGSGEMLLGEDTFEVKAGDTVAILPRVRHHIRNKGKTALKFLCCCAPPYSHEDTELLDEP